MSKEPESYTLESLCPSCDALQPHHTDSLKEMVETIAADEPVVQLCMNCFCVGALGEAHYPKIIAKYLMEKI